MVFNKFAAGRKVYGQTAASPTRGTNDPSGYIKRELARQSQQRGVSKIGKDGQSDTRSGLAHNAIIKNNLGNNIGRTKANPIKPPGAPRQDANLPQYNASRNAAPPVGAAPAAVAPAGVPVSPTGQLQLPYDSAYFGQVLSAQQNFDAEMMNIGFEDQNQAIDFQRFMRDLDEAYGNRQRATLNDSGARGTLQSSQYATAVNNDTREYTTSKTDAETDNNNFMNQQNSRRTAAQTFFNQVVQQAAAEFAERYARDQAAAAALATPEPAVVPGEVIASAPGPAPGTGLSQWNGNSWTGNWGVGNGGNKNNNAVGRDNRPPKPGPNYEWNAMKHKWVKK